MSEPLHDTRGLVPLFERGSLDASEPFASSPLPNYEENLIYAQYDKRLKSYLIGALDIFRQYEIFLPDSNIEDFQELVDTVQKQLIPEVEAQMAIDCNDIEDCLDTSPIITNIENTLVTVQGDVTNVTNVVNNHTSEITNLTENVTNLTENVITNEYPEYPDPIPSPDAYCGASWKLANYLNGFIQDVITDAGTITFTEFIEALLGLGGFKVSIVKQLWDFAVVTTNPNLSTEVSGTIEDVAEIFYCARLDRSEAIDEINSNLVMTSDAKASYISAINSLTDGKFSELIFLGSLDESQNCSGFICGQWCNLLDYSISQYETVIVAGEYTGEYIKSANVGGNSQLIVDYYMPPNNFKSYYFEAWKIDHASINHSWGVYNEAGGLITSGGINNNVRPRQFTNIVMDQVNVARFRLTWQASGLDKQFRLYSGRLIGIGLNPSLGVEC